MAVEKLKFVNLFGPADTIDAVLSDVCMHSELHPEAATELMKNASYYFPYSSANPYAAAFKQAGELIKKMGFEPSAEACSERPDFEAASSELSKIRQGYEALEAEKYSLSCVADEDREVIKQLSPILNTNVTLDRLFNLEFVKFRFGKMPRETYDILCSYAANDSRIIFLTSAVEKEYVWLMYFSPVKFEERNDSLMASLHFQRIRISDKAHGTPHDAYEGIMGELSATNEKITDVSERIAKYSSENIAHLKSLYSIIKHYYEVFELRRYAVHTDTSFYITGWIPAKAQKSFERRAVAIEGVSCVFEDPETDKELVSPPTKLKNFRLFRPFEEFVEMYGLPIYNEFDPTPLVALTYCLLFGLMFGDIGQGLVLALGGLLIWLFKKARLGAIIAMCGVSSSLFGLFYGSFFGYEGVVGDFSPLHNQTHFYIALGASIGIGVVLLLVCMIINIINGIRQKNIEKALFSNNGLAGLVFYFSVILGVLMLFAFNKNILTPIYLICFAAVPLLLIFFKDPLSAIIEKKKHEKAESKAQFFIQNFFELFEVLLSFITNTLSFVRIGAFALNHAGLMMFVFILARMSGESENMLTIIIGNAFVIGLEGLIVGIQTLRLQFYELFSRFYSGEGRPFKSIKIDC